jgi:hypothetical protein
VDGKKAQSRREFILGKTKSENFLVAQAQLKNLINECSLEAQTTKKAFP